MFSNLHSAFFNSFDSPIKTQFESTNFGKLKEDRAQRQLPHHVAISNAHVQRVKPNCTQSCLKTETRNYDNVYEGSEQVRCCRRRRRAASASEFRCLATGTSQTELANRSSQLSLNAIATALPRRFSSVAAKTYHSNKRRTNYSLLIPASILLAVFVLISSPSECKPTEGIQNKLELGDEKQFPSIEKEVEKIALINPTTAATTTPTSEQPNTSRAICDILPGLNALDCDKFKFKKLQKEEVEEKKEREKEDLVEEEEEDEDGTGARVDDGDAESCKGLSADGTAEGKNNTDNARLVNLQTCLQEKIKTRLLSATRSGLELFEKLSLTGSCSASLMKYATSLRDLKSFAFKCK